VNTAAKKPVHPRAAIQAQAKPRSINKPHAAESAPKVPPDIRAVFAPEGFDKNPASPQRIKKTPNATNQRPLVFITPYPIGEADDNFNPELGLGFIFVHYSDLNLVNYSETFFSLSDKAMRWIGLLTLAAFFTPRCSAIHTWDTVVFSTATF
jgi:hypothetical protein